MPPSRITWRPRTAATRRCTCSSGARTTLLRPTTASRASLTASWRRTCRGSRRWPGGCSTKQAQVGLGMRCLKVCQGTSFASTGHNLVGGCADIGHEAKSCVQIPIGNSMTPSDQFFEICAQPATLPQMRILLTRGLKIGIGATYARPLPALPALTWWRSN